MGIETIALASLAVGALGTGASVIGQIQQSQAQSQAQSQQAAMYAAQARYQQQVAQQNQDFARQQGERQAADARQRGEVAEAQARRRTSLMLGTQQAALAGQGTDLEGSPLDILGDTAAAGEFDALTIRSNADREAYGFRLQGEMAGAGYGNEATMAGYKAANAGSGYTPSYLGAGASLLAGASNLSEKWLRFQGNGSQPRYGTIDGLITDQALA